MRRKDREIKDFAKMMEILETCDCCRLGLTDDDGAYIVPMNFGYEESDDNLVLYFHCAKEGRKIGLIKKQGKASFEMDSKHELASGERACDFSYMYQCVMGKGRIEILNDNDAKIHGLQKIMRHYSEREDWEFRREMTEAVTVLKLTVTEWSCKVH